MGVLRARDCWMGDGGEYCSSSPWGNWGRWVALAVIIVVAFLLVFLFACMNARRRRRYGQRPFRGTQWMAGGAPPPTEQPYYYPNTPPYPPPPQYSQNPNPQTYGYFGGQQPQQNGIELQSPPHAYYGGQRAYEPPQGPPPNKT
ncbi:hypothetical protein ASPZODRAFT_144040 [Penicilliopsis zonata CBS 506.65]|uniref:Chitin synthesis regulation, resistance to congo red-domain-containing protein n=1 Tax=Penicilliopsis zonata CBS 506.65 TaxID=1073090 RepID=A0A1L9SE82_9EURO|nr:hypothetical protein ASPZODRAFT_144040 [Penicilliopsis zonata CBS 506.65]OJJ45407.1 hypothetical protein ASPZODRAFT_144040 [Penicilliopsis zonata CBS 506.65]